MKNYIQIYEQYRGISRKSDFNFDELLKTAAEIGTQKTIMLKERRMNEYKLDQKRALEYAENATKKFVEVFNRIQANPNDRAIAENPEVLAFLDTYVGSNAQSRQATIKRFDDLLNGKLKLEDVVKKTITDLKDKYIARQLKKDRSSLSELKEFLSLFPKNMVVDLDPQGVVESIRDRFANEGESLDVKHERMVDVLSVFDQIKSKVYSDLRLPFGSNGQCAALAVAIMIDTGMRPGSKKNGVWVDADTNRVLKGPKDRASVINKIWLRTYGISNIETQHVRFTGSSAVLNFRGKMGTMNNGVVTTPIVVDLLRQYYDDAIAKNRNHILVNKKGNTLSLDSVANYCSKYNFRPTDLRKLKATESFHENLMAEQDQLYKELREIAQGKSIRTLVVKAVYGAIMRALKKSQVTLSHENVTVTINKYVNPRILLNYLSQGRVGDSFTDMIMNGKTKLEFNFSNFILAALEAA